MTPTILSILSIFFLMSTASMSAFLKAVRVLPRKESLKIFKDLGGAFFYRSIHSLLFPKQGLESILFSAMVARALSRFCYTISALYFLLAIVGYVSIVGFIGIFIFGFIFGEFIPRVIGNYSPSKSILYSSSCGSFLLLLSLPITLLFLKISKPLTRIVYSGYLQEPEGKAKREILEIIQDAKMEHGLAPADRQLLESAVSFRNRIVREVMVPRVDMFCLPADTPIHDAVRLIEDEGFSRIPVYKSTVDDVIGVLMYKDLLRSYHDYCENDHNPSILQTHIENLVKPPLYTPETKRISDLLQDFRRQQVHIAIVVDEYGGTEGMITIEDILEEIVGEIEDEYDDESDLFIAHPDGSFVLDAKMGIIDVEEETGIQLPQEGDYDTVGGFIYHKAGAIPTEGFTILQEHFKLEVIQSHERAVEKVRISPILSEADAD